MNYIKEVIGYASMKNRIPFGTTHVILVSNKLSSEEESKSVWNISADYVLNVIIYTDD